ncbi:MAG: redoxin domain-containing protein [Phycisphaerales bacterium]|nr:redoxin domain-containing protein [Phycisphaerales bacterium]
MHTRWVECNSGAPTTRVDFVVRDLDAAFYLYNIARAQPTRPMIPIPGREDALVYPHIQVRAETVRKAQFLEVRPVRQPFPLPEVGRDLTQPVYRPQEKLFEHIEYVDTVIDEITTVAGPDHRNRACFEWPDIRRAAPSTRDETGPTPGTKAPTKPAPNGTVNVGPQLLSVGQQGPLWKLRDAQGQAHSLSDYLGKVIVLEFWATWCAPCQASLPTIQRLHDRFKDHGAVVVGIATWEKGDPAKYMSERNYTYQLLLGGDEVAKQYGVKGIPARVVLDRNGRVIYTGNGPAVGPLADELVSALVAVLGKGEPNENNGPAVGLPANDNRPLSLEEVTEDLRRLWGEIRSFSATSQETRVGKGVSITTTETLAVLKSGATMLRKTDAAQTVTMNGKVSEARRASVWDTSHGYTYEQSNGRRIATRQTRAKLSARQSAECGDPLALLQGMQTQMDIKAVRTGVVHDRSCYVVECVAKFGDGDARGKASVFFCKNTGLCIRVDGIDQDGSKYELELSDIKVNPPIDESTFRLDIPSDVKIQEIPTPPE